MNILEARRRTLGKGVYKKTVEGNPAIAQGSLARMYPGITMQGWTEQAQYEGKNLFDKTKIEDRIDTTHTQTDTGIEVSGLYYVTYRVSVTPNTDMYIRYNKSGEGLNQVSVYGTDTSADNPISSSYSKGMKFNTGNHTEILVLFYSSSGTENVSIYNDVMLNLGATALPYEPYTGGQPSPSPDYPQEIVSAGKYNEDTQKYEYQVKLTGKNLWNAEEAAETSKWVASTSQKGYSDFAIKVKPGEKVTFSFPEKLPLGKGFYVGIVTSENGSIIKWLYHDLIEHLIVQQATVTAITDKIWIRCNTGFILKFASDNPYFQVEYGEERTDFQPYKEQTVLLTSDRPLTKWDRLEKRGGQWGWVYKSAEIVLDGSEDEAWRVFSTDSFNQFYINIDTVEHLSNEKNAYCKKFRPAVIGDKETEKEIIYSVTGGIAVSTELATELDAWKTWIQSNPITVLYRSIEETFVPLSTAEQEQMNELYAFRPTTVLSNDAGCNMELTYKTKKSLEVAT